MARTTADALPVSTFEPDATPKLDSIVSKMLAREPAERYQTPAEVARALEPFCVLPADVLTLVTEEETLVSTADAAPPQEAVPVSDVPEAQPDQKTARTVQEPTHVDAVAAERAPSGGDGEKTPAAVTEHPAGSDYGQSVPPIDPRLEVFLTDLATEAAGDRKPKAVKKKTGRPRKRDGVATRKRKKKKKQVSSRRPRHR